ncbi:MAG: HD domain-containing protein [bacterium]
MNAPGNGVSSNSVSGNDVSGLLQALRFAAEKHRDHRRKGATAAPYINHPITVAEQLAAFGLGSDMELLMAAILHDVVEDTDTTEAELVEVFGKRVARIVMEVTDDNTLRRTERKKLVVSKISGKSREARLLKLSDLIANIGDMIHHPPHWTDDRKREYLDWGEAVVNRLRGTHEGLEARFDALLQEGRGILNG